MPVTTTKIVKSNYPKKGKKKKKGRLEPMGIRGMSQDYAVVVPIETEPLMVSSTVSAVSLSHVFILDDIINDSNYAMFDQYRLAWVEVKVTPVYTGMVTTDADVTGAVAANERTPNYVFYIDRDDSSTALTYNSVRVRKGAVVRKATQPYYRKFRPNALSQLYNGVSPLPAYQIVTDPAWIDMANNTCPHYGLKMVLEAGGNANGQYQLRVEMRYCYNFSNRRT